MPSGFAMLEASPCSGALRDQMAARLAIEYAEAAPPRKHGVREQIMRVPKVAATG
jgi:hypothetical protein